MFQFIFSNGTRQVGHVQAVMQQVICCRVLNIRIFYAKMQAVHLRIVHLLQGGSSLLFIFKLDESRALAGPGVAVTKHKRLNNFAE